MRKWKPLSRQLRMLLALTTMVSALGACQSVEPWERGKLAKRSMALEDDRLSAGLREQVYFSKEGSAGGITAAGGGCGCN